MKSARNITIADRPFSFGNFLDKSLDKSRQLCYYSIVISNLISGCGGTADALVSGSSVARRVGSNPVIRTMRRHPDFLSGCFCIVWAMGFEVGAVVNDSLNGCQSRERPRRAVRAASHNPVIRTKKYCRKGYFFCSIFLSIAKAMVYHHALACISSPQAYIINRRLYTFAMMIYSPESEICSFSDG